MNAFEPFMTHSPSTSLADVLVAPASEPPPGSVSPNPFASGERREPPLTLLVGPEVPDRHGPEPDGGLERDRQRGVDPGELLDRQAEGEEIAPHPPVFLGKGQPEQTELGHLFHGAHGELPLGVPALRMGADGVVDEGPDRLLKLLLLEREIEVHEERA